jgi:HSP20 family protein
MSSQSTGQSHTQQDHVIQQGTQTHPSQQGQQGQSSQLSTRGQGQGRSNLPAQTGMRRTQLSPFDLFDEMQNQMARLWGGNLLGAWPFARSQQGQGGMMANFPRVDVFERDNQLVVKAELPGVKKQDIDLSVQDGDLIIQASRNQEQESNQNNYYRMERQYGTFYREIPLPEGVQTDKIQASLNVGVLEVDIPMPTQQQTQGQKIQVK